MGWWRKQPDQGSCIYVRLGAYVISCARRGASEYLELRWWLGHTCSLDQCSGLKEDRWVHRWLEVVNQSFAGGGKFAVDALTVTHWGVVRPRWMVTCTDSHGIHAGGPGMGGSDGRAEVGCVFSPSSKQMPGLRSSSGQSCGLTCLLRAVVNAEQWLHHWSGASGTG